MLGNDGELRLVDSEWWVTHGRYFTGVIQQSLMLAVV